jgi:hypothetical protein
MPFSRAQQGLFRPIVNTAWAGHATAQGLDPKDKDARRAWYEDELEKAIGIRSTSDADPRADFEKAMAHFEAITGEGIYWNLRLHKGDRRRILHQLQQLADEYDLDERYLQGIAKQSLKAETLPDLDQLTAEHLLRILFSLRKHTRRLKRAAQTEQPF